MVNIAVAQFAPGVDKQQNEKTIAELVRMAARQGARLVVLPEYAMFTAPTMDQRFLDTAESISGPFVGGLGDLAKELSVFIVAGINEAIEGLEKISNTVVAVGPEGDVVAVYRKLHLYDAFGYKESNLVRPGQVEAPETFEVDGFCFGMQTCYDLRFPEVTRRIVDAGAQVLLLPSEWVPGPLKEDHWTTLVRARAIENTIYVAAADQCAPTGAGNSMIVDPMGLVLASLGEQTAVAVAELVEERLQAVRLQNPALELRRFNVAATV